IICIAIRRPPGKTFLVLPNKACRFPPILNSIIIGTSFLVFAITGIISTPLKFSTLSTPSICLTMCSLSLYVCGDIVNSLLICS
ncbi:unnamed protein product, partial [Rhizophagus irregularis]